MNEHYDLFLQSARKRALATQLPLPAAGPPASALALLNASLNQMPGGVAPHHVPYFKVDWRPHENITAHVTRTLADLTGRTLTTEPSYTMLFGDDTDVAGADQPALIAAFDAALVDGATRGAYASKFVIWRSANVAHFDAQMKYIRTTACARLLNPSARNTP